MKFLPLTDDDRTAMLDACGFTEAQIFAAVPPSEIEGFTALSEPEIMAGLAPLAHPIAESVSGLGVGRYFIPAVVDNLTSRGEFVTAYTPYQPECSQGTLGAIFEFQSRVCSLTGLDISNAGLYDGSTALVEAVRMALGESGQGPGARRNEVLVARSLAPAWREVLRAHFAARDVVFREIPFDAATGRLAFTADLVTDKTAAVVAASPNVFGVLERDLATVFAATRERGAVPIHVFHPLAVTLTPKPADLGAEIAVAEGQPLGIPLWAGGPYVGLMAASQKFLRRMPGRIAGHTVDAEGRDAFVLTLQTREQHIRRERATSNICTNQALIALRATVYLAAMGLDGLRTEARRLKSKAVVQSEGKRLFSGEIFNEFVVRGRGPSPGSGVVGLGIPLDYPELGEISLFGVAS